MKKDLSGIASVIVLVILMGSCATYDYGVNVPKGGLPRGERIEGRVVGGGVSGIPIHWQEGRFIDKNENNIVRKAIREAGIKSYWLEDQRFNGRFLETPQRSKERVVIYEFNGTNIVRVYETVTYSTGYTFNQFLYMKRVLLMGQFKSES
jgi:hypothetical protein